MRFTTTQDQRSERLLKAFKVKCPNSEKGCVWEGDLGDTEDHIKNNCPHQQVNCPNGCRQTMERKLLPAHKKNSCTHRKYSCPHCWEEGLYKVITEEHLVICPLLMLDCPAKCGQRIKRRFMEFHLSLECSEEYVSCKYVGNGCDTLVKRKDKGKHESDDSFHLQMVIRSQAQLLQSFTKCLIATSLDSADLSPLTSLPLSSRPWLQNTPTCYPVPPCIVKFEEISDVRRDESQSIYSHFGGYKVQLSIRTLIEPENTSHKHLGPKINTHLRINLQKGFTETPHSLPFEGEIEVTLLNQLRDENHCPLEIERVIPNHPPKLSFIGANHVEYESIAYEFRARLDEIISLHETCSFVQNNCVFFRVDKITI
jgi:hypothetical protein